MSKKSTPTPSDPEFDPAISLTAEEGRIRDAIAEIDLALAQTNDPDADADHDFSEEGGEGAGAAVDRDRDTAMRAQLLERLSGVEEARHRLEEGSYGSCRTCGKPIAEARLEVLPAATECVNCASAPLLTRRSR